MGAGEILLTSIDMDGTKNGYDINLTKEIVNAVSIPVVASGGCGKPEDMINIFKETNVEAALAASIFHYETHSVGLTESFFMYRLFRPIFLPNFSALTSGVIPAFMLIMLDLSMIGSNSKYLQ